MNNYYISRLYLENFKSVDKALIKFEGKNLNVLDGPNGFGKTTIFDAIELVLTGKIRRIVSNKIASTNRGYSDHLLSKDQNKLTIVKLEFTSKNDPSNRIVIARALLPNRLSVSQKRPGNFENYKLYRLKDIYDEISEDKLFESYKLNELFNINDNFMLYHYIEQEESSYFLKQNERDRMEAISKLFKIEDELSQKKFIEKIKNKLMKHRNDIAKILNKEDNNENIKAKPIEVPYFRLIRDEEIQINWDQKDLHNISRELKEEYHVELENLKLFVECFPEFKLELRNMKLDRVAQDTERLKALIVCGYFWVKINELENRYNSQKKLIDILNVIKQRELLYKEIDWSIVNEIVKDIPTNEIVSKLSQLKIVHNNTNKMSKIIDKMNIERVQLTQMFKDYLRYNDTKDNYCPLCGSEKENYEKLMASIEQQTLALKSELDGAAKYVTEEMDSLYRNYLDDIAEKLERKLQETTIISEDFLTQLKSQYKVISDYNKEFEWFTQLNIDLNRYINKKEKYIHDHDLNEIVTNLRRDILEKKQPISNKCRDNMTTFQNLYDRFKSKDQVIQKITLNDIENKKMYIDYQYYLQLNQNYIKIKKMKEKHDRLNQLVESINRILEIYNNKINMYRAKMISDIEIPFYIYSGKIIQTHQRGIGVFIKEELETPSNEENQLKVINFVPPEKTDHDILHTFSSGQLASTVIAFTLALNKVYSKQGFSTLLIDDPVQTMDEMNMASLVELLRNDFHDRQIILSTHEEKVSLYFRYKFLKYGYSIGNINVKKEFTPQNIRW